MQLTRESNLANLARACLAAEATAQDERRAVTHGQKGFQADAEMLTFPGRAAFGTLTDPTATWHIAAQDQALHEGN